MRKDAAGITSRWFVLMEQNKNSAASIAGLIFALQGSPNIFDDFVCHENEKCDGLVFCAESSLLDGSEKLVSEHAEVNVYLKSNGATVFASPRYAELLQVSLAADYKALEYYIAPDARGFSFESVLRNLFRTAIESLYSVYSRVSFHSACIEINGQALAFTGASGMGKSTRARAWIGANNAELISGDRPTLHIKNDGVTAYGVPWDGKEQLFRQANRPLKAIFEVRRSDSVHLRRLDARQAEKLILHQTFIPMWDTTAAAMTIMNIKKLARTVPVYRLFSPPHEEAAREAYRIIFENTDEISEASTDMKIKEGFALKALAGDYIVMPTGGKIAEFEGAVVLNEVSAFLFEKMLNPISKEDLLAALLDEYEVDEETAESGIDTLIDKFNNMGIIE